MSYPPEVYAIAREHGIAPDVVAEAWSEAGLPLEVGALEGAADGAHFDEMFSGMHRPPEARTAPTAQQATYGDLGSARIGGSVTLPARDVLTAAVPEVESTDRLIDVELDPTVAPLWAINVSPPVLAPDDTTILFPLDQGVVNGGAVLMRIRSGGGGARGVPIDVDVGRGCQVIVPATSVQVTLVDRDNIFRVNPVPERTFHAWAQPATGGPALRNTYTARSYLAGVPATHHFRIPPFARDVVFTASEELGSAVTAEFPVLADDGSEVGRYRATLTGGLQMNQNPCWIPGSGVVISSDVAAGTFNPVAIFGVQV